MQQFNFEIFTCVEIAVLLQLVDKFATSLLRHILLTSCNIFMVYSIINVRRNILVSSDECFASFDWVVGNVVVVCTVGFVVLVSLLTVSVPTFCVVLRFVSTPATSGVCFAGVVAVVFGAAVVVVGLFCPSKTSVNGHFGTSKKHCSEKQR